MKSIQLNVSIVEPFVQNSTLGGLKGGHDAIQFRDMFNLETFNNGSLSEGVPRIIPYSTYLQHAPRKAVFVKFQRQSRKLSKIPLPLPPPEVVWSAPAGSEECYRPDVNSSIVPPTYPDNHYCYVRIVRAYHQILNQNIITKDQFYSTVLGSGELVGVTLVLSLWRTPWHVKRCPEVTVSSPKIQQSPRLVEAVERYRKQFLLSDGQYIAVMLRSEHAYLMTQSQIRFHKPTRNTLQQCLNDTLAKARSLMADMRTSSVFVTADAGMYGTSSWKESVHRGHRHELPGIIAQVQEIVEKLYRGRWSFHDWEQSFSEATGGVKDRGYVAALQRGLASNAACLVLLGGGSFQRLALTSYLQHTKTHGQPQCVHLVCMDRMYNEQFNALIH